MDGIRTIVAPCGYDGKADFYCTGSHDEITIRAAVDECVRRNNNLFFIDGVYRIDGFYDFGDGGAPAAVRIPSAWREIRVEGQNHEYGMQKRYDNGVVFRVSKAALDSVKGEKAVIRGENTAQGIQNGTSLRLENIAVVLADNQSEIRCVDLRRVDRVELKNVSLISYGDAMDNDGNVGLFALPPVSAKGCIGLTMTDGSNYNYSNYENVHAWGFDEGIQVGGEHVVCVNCGATLCCYGFTFGNYPVNNGANHPITLINCLDERNINLPFFGDCGDGDGKGGRLYGGQEVNLICFNIERTAEHTPGGKLGDLMREKRIGTWRGTIEFTAQPAWCHLNSVDFAVWENDGSGSGIRTRNVCHKEVCTTAERLGYYPTLGQRIFDTDLNKMLVCIDPAKRLWVDFNGEKVD